MFDNIRSAAADTARRTAFGLAAGLTLFIGLLFLTAAAWILVESVADALTAALVLGAVYLGIGLILLAFALTRRDSGSIRHEALTAAPIDQKDLGPKGLAAAFFEGLGAGLTARDQFARRQGDAKPNGSGRM